MFARVWERPAMSSDGSNGISCAESGAVAPDSVVSTEPGENGADAAVGADGTSGAGAAAGVETASTAGRRRVAVFDFDGTSIQGNSPVLLVRYLQQRGMLRKRVVSRILAWAAAYKLRLPQNESWVRGLVFTAFEGRPVAEVDQFLYDFYDEKIDGRFRAVADEAMRAHAADGVDPLIVSATFEPIVRRAMEFHPIAGQVSTRMKVASDGTYTCEVEGLPVEGSEKICAIKRLCDERYGEGGWELAYAYGDHHSDSSMLSAAEHAFAVSPDRPLARTARVKGWTILEW